MILVAGAVFYYGKAYLESVPKCNSKEVINTLNEMLKGKFTENLSAKGVVATFNNIKDPIEESYVDGIRKCRVNISLRVEEKGKSATISFDNKIEIERFGLRKYQVRVLDIPLRI